ncbi:SNF2 helicase associated domain-containing protein [Clostridium paraputrificum]|uniref:DEAD/DEAH box helicase n=1 Tax=Clostridium paraputrificum TaxID=29363 RepID=UPI003D3298E8
MLRTLENILNKSTSDFSLKKGERLVRNGLVEEVKAGEAFGAYSIDGKISSEYGNSTYTTKVVVDLGNEGIRVTYCSCMDYEKHYLRGNRKYLCKHLIATLVRNNQVIKERVKEERENKKSRLDKLGSLLLQELEEEKSPKEKVNLEISITRSRGYKFDNIDVEFKIGQHKMYVLKNIEAFLNALESGDDIAYGKEFVYTPLNSYFSKEDEKLVEFIKEYINIGYRVNEGSYARNTLVSGKVIRIVNTSFASLLKSLVGRTINFKIDNDEFKSEVIEGDVPVSLLLGEDDNGVYLESFEKLPVRVTDVGDVYLYEGDLYVISKRQQKSLNTIYSYLEESKRISFNKEDSAKVFNYVMPELQVASKKFQVEESLQKKIVKEKPIFNIYFDKMNGIIFCDVKIIYGQEEINLFRYNNSHKHIIRDIEKEEELINELEKFQFYKSSKYFIFNGNDDDMYYFLVRGAEILQSFGELYYSESFKNYNIRKTPSIKAAIKEKDRGFLEVNFHVEGVGEEETNKLLLAIKENKRFFKLKDESFLDLEQDEFKELFTLIEGISGEDNDLGTNLNVPKNKAFYLQEALDNSRLLPYSGEEVLKDITNKLQELASQDYTLPEELKGTLREYQITGFKWLKTLSYLGFGGVLADEMGLGKTLQTIAFILSEENKSTLIVTPTSLIYNWENEFKKFAPSLKVAIIHGAKKERLELIEKSRNYDVILTTYGTLRNDIELYKGMKFDYCIIDEGQNIKNPLAQNTETVKEVNAGVKFALSGTPIENSLMELWSIFDFVMPGYLYSRKVFQNKFISGSNIELLKSLIRPFILRRLKKDVMKELPDKIEKKFYVDLVQNQKKVYKIIADEAKNDFANMDPRDSRIAVLAALTKLRQICLEPSIVVEDYNGGSGKVDVALEILEGYIESGDKVLLFSQFTSLLKIMANYLDKAGIGYYYLDGSTKASERINLVNKFNEGEDKKIFLISLKAGGSGLNLTSANVVIHFDPWWNPAIEDQASDRAHRIGQKKVVEVIKLIAKGTIEEKVVELQEEKKELISKVVDGEYTDGGYIAKISTEDLMSLITS